MTVSIEKKKDSLRIQVHCRVKTGTRTQRWAALRAAPEQ
jgi:hypothetical protein